VGFYAWLARRRGKEKEGGRRIRGREVLWVCIGARTFGKK